MVLHGSTQFSSSFRETRGSASKPLAVLALATVFMREPRLTPNAIYFHPPAKSGRVDGDVRASGEGEISNVS